MSLLINHAKSWAFVHIPKTGGTTITKILSEDTDVEFVTSHDSLRLIPDNYYIFTFVRNPFTRLASAWMHGVRKNLYNPSFDYFLKEVNENDVWILPQTFYTNAGKGENKKVSFIGKYEDFNNDLEKVLTKINVKYNKIPHLNRNPIYNNHPNLKQHSYYKHLFQEKWMIDWVHERYYNDFKIFNYGMDL